LGRPSTRTAVTTSRASDIPHPHVLRCERCRETGGNYVVKPDTPSDTNWTYTSEIRFYQHSSLARFVLEGQSETLVKRGLLRRFSRS
jgi:hypothetical protein